MTSENVLNSRSSVLNNEENSLNLMAMLDALKLDIHEIKSSLSKPPAQLPLAVPGSTSSGPAQGAKETDNLEAVISAASQVVTKAAEIVYHRSEASKLDDPDVPGLTDDKRLKIAQWLATSSNRMSEEELPLSPSTATYSVAPSDIFDSRVRQGTLDTELSTPSPGAGVKNYYPGWYQVAEPEEVLETGGVATGNLVGSVGFPWHSPSPPPVDGRVLEPSPHAIEAIPEPHTGIAPIDTVELSTKPAVETFELDTSAEDLLLTEWRESGLTKFSLGEYEESELYLEKALQQCRSIYGTSSDRQSPILHILGSALAHQGKCHAVENLLDTMASADGWRYSVIEIILTVSLEEGKSSQATRLLSKYSQELVGRDEILTRLLWLCTKNMMWSVAHQIIERYRFCTRETDLETCVTLTREQRNWSHCATFLREQVKGKLEGAKTASQFHALAEVYVELKDVSTAREFCQKAVNGRLELGTKSQEAQESIYLLARLAYEGDGRHVNRVEYDSAVKLLRHRTKGFP